MVDKNPDYCQSFWSLIVPAGSTVPVEYDDCTCLYITSACIPDFNGSSKPNKLVAHVKILEAENEDGEKNEKEVEEEVTETTFKYHEATIDVCKFYPDSLDYSGLNIEFTPFELVEFKNEGDYDIHVAGYQHSIIVLGGEEEEEEEKGEEAEQLTPDEIQARFKKLSESQPERPPYVPKKKKGNKSKQNDENEEEKEVEE